MKTKGYIDNIHTPTSKGFIHNIDPLIPQASYCSGFTAEARSAIRRLRENLHSFGVYFPLKPCLAELLHALSPENKRIPSNGIHYV